MNGLALQTIPARGEYTAAAQAQRLEWLRGQSGAPLVSLDGGRLDARRLPGNVENFVASVELPVGLAGPLLFTGQHARGLITAPMATTEGALVASASRGARAISLSGGVTTRVLSQRMTRAPAYEFADICAAAKFVTWLEIRRPEIEAAVAPVSHHARLVGVEPYQIGRYVHVRFVFETADAAGQNMTTGVTANLCRWIARELADTEDLRPSLFLIEGNMSGDKKLSQLSLVAGRGTRVTSECFIDRATVEAVLKTTPEMLDRAQRCALLGSQQSGMVGYSVNVANVVAALFVATGQDVACVHESGTGIFSMECTVDGLRALMLLPSLVVGTVGGGTRLPRQRDFLESMGCAGDGHAARLAEIIAGFALALDLSTASAIAGGQFVAAHQRLGRARPVRWLGEADLSPQLVQPMLAESLRDNQIHVDAVTAPDDLADSGILSGLGARAEQRKLLGLHPLRITYTHGDGRQAMLDVVAKVKALDEELLLATGKLAALSGEPVARAWARWGGHTEMKDSHTRELALYRHTGGEPVLRAVMPKCFGVLEDPDREAYLVLMERLDPACLGASWRRPEIEAALRGIAPVHRRWLGREGELLDAALLGQVPGPALLVKAHELWTVLAEHNAAEHAGLVDPATLKRLLRLAGDAHSWSRGLEQMPRTLVHNDFNPRNIGLRAGRQLVAYDWELATLDVPQRDLAELLAFTLTPGAGTDEVAHYLEAHRIAVDPELDPAGWREGYRLALQAFLLTRLQMYIMAHTHHEYAFLPRLAQTAWRLWELES